MRARADTISTLVTLLPLLCCSRAARTDSRPAVGSEIASPAGPGSSEPGVSVGPDGRFWLSWVEPGGESQHSLWIAHRRPGGAWSEPVRVAEGANWFVNRADVPSVVVLPDGSLVAHWLVKNSGSGHGHDVRVARSSDSGATWSAPTTPHRDGTAAEHGFASLYPAGAGRAGLVWLDGRDVTPGRGRQGQVAGAMTLRHASLGSDGSLADELELDDRVCDCCQTAAVRVEDRVLVAYRDRSEQEIRDISLVRYLGGRWSAPEALSKDGWKIAGCPVNGPAIAASARNVAVAWYAAPEGSGRVLLARSRDAGDSFGEPIRVDDGQPLGRVDVEVVETGEALVTWLEAAETESRLRLRSVGADGVLGTSFNVGQGASSSRGFPRFALSGREALVTWTDTGKPSKVRTAVVEIPAAGQPR